MNKRDDTRLQRDLAMDFQTLKYAFEQQAQALLASLLASAWVVEARDPYTGGHLWRVAALATELGLALGLAPNEVSRIAMAGFLHDFGKIGIPDAILHKPERLTDEEYAVIKTHPAVGARLLAGHPLAGLIVPVVLGHHETPDGKGYPRGLSGAAITLDARIIGICDAFDAMTSTRPYRKGMPVAKALNIVQAEAGRQFDAELVQQFVALGLQGRFDHIVEHSADGIPLGRCPVCGPTIVRQRQARANEHVACPSCQAQFLWQQGDHQLEPVATGRRASPDELAPQADLLQIRELVERWSDALEISDQLQSGPDAYRGASSFLKVSGASLRKLL